MAIEAECAECVRVWRVCRNVDICGGVCQSVMIVAECGGQWHSWRSVAIESECGK